MSDPFRERIYEGNYADAGTLASVLESEGI
jgi:hypothetical protein